MRFIPREEVGAMRQEALDEKEAELKNLLAIQRDFEDRTAADFSETNRQLKKVPGHARKLLESLQHGGGSSAAVAAEMTELMIKLQPTLKSLGHDGQYDAYALMRKVLPVVLSQLAKTERHIAKIPVPEHRKIFAIQLFKNHWTGPREPKGAPFRKYLRQMLTLAGARLGEDTVEDLLEKIPREEFL